MSYSACHFISYFCWRRCVLSHCVMRNELKPGCASNDILVRLHCERLVSDIIKRECTNKYETRQDKDKTRTRQDKEKAETKPRTYTNQTRQDRPKENQTRQDRLLNYIYPAEEVGVCVCVGG
jgi:hypothetical protein